MPKAYTIPPIGSFLLANLNHWDSVGYSGMPSRTTVSAHVETVATAGKVVRLTSRGWEKSPVLLHYHQLPASDIQCGPTSVLTVSWSGSRGESLFMRLSGGWSLRISLRGCVLPFSLVWRFYSPCCLCLWDTSTCSSAFGAVLAKKKRKEKKGVSLYFLSAPTWLPAWFQSSNSWLFTLSRSSDGII